MERKTLSSEKGQKDKHITDSADTCMKRTSDVPSAYRLLSIGEFECSITSSKEIIIYIQGKTSAAMFIQGTIPQSYWECITWEGI